MSGPLRDRLILEGGLQVDDGDRHFVRLVVGGDGGATGDLIHGTSYALLDLITEKPFNY